MRKITALLIVLILVLSVSTFCSCMAYEGPPITSENTPDGEAGSPEANDFGISENPEISTAEKDNINFSIDTNVANYMLFKNVLLDKDNSYYLLRQDLAKLAQADQMLNYFSYDYSEPEDGEIIALNASVFDNPFNAKSKLLTVGLKAREQELNEKANNIVVLLDVSGSMASETKLGMAKIAILTMVENLAPSDKLSLVTYANTSKKLLDGISANEYDAIEKTVNSLSASGSTNGEDGLDKAYSAATEHFIEDGNNRVILMSDGDFNVGISSEKELKEYITDQRDKGVYLSCIGFGEAYNYSLATMETLAKNGNGNWGYIHNENDIRKLLVTGLNSTLVTIAKDVKANISFNSEVVSSFRLIGYESNIISDDEYKDDATDAGEIGSGFTLTICFEIVLNDAVDLTSNTENFAQVNLKYKTPADTATTPSQELALPVDATCFKTALNDDDLFVSSVIEFALIAIDSKYKADASIDNVIARLEELNLTDNDKLEFLQVVKTYDELFFA